VTENGTPARIARGDENGLMFCSIVPAIKVVRIVRMKSSNGTRHWMGAGRTAAPRRNGSSVAGTEIGAPFQRVGACSGNGGASSAGVGLDRLNGASSGQGPGIAFTIIVVWLVSPS